MPTPRLMFPVLCFLFSLIAQSSYAQEVLFVTGNTRLSSADTTVKRDLEAAGMQVEVVRDSESAASDANGKNLVLISESSLSTRVGSKFTRVRVPVAVYESHLYDDLGMSSQSRGSYGNDPDQHSLYMRSTHPLSGGFSGAVRVSAARARLSWAIPGSEAIVAATLRWDRFKATIFGYEAGATLANGMKAPARRVGLFPHAGSIDNRTSASRDLFLAAVQWAMSTPEDDVQLAAADPVNEAVEDSPVEPEAEAPSSGEEPPEETENDPVNEAAEDTPVTTEDPAEPTTPPVSEPPVVPEVPNVAPSIADTSYQCDPASELVAYAVGEEDFFTLSVDDESLLTLKYDADSSNEAVASVVVDDNGVFKVTALRRGESFLWLTVEDEDGLVDEFELSVVVQ